MVKKREAKKEVYFIATKYKNLPTRVNFYTGSGEMVPKNSVAKTDTNKGVRFFTSYSLE